MGCFEDFMQFRDEVDGIKKRGLLRETTNVRRCREDLEKTEEDIGKPNVKA
jgi:hypothetical protein